MQIDCNIEKFKLNLIQIFKYSIKKIEFKDYLIDSRLRCRIRNKNNSSEVQ